jgi:hypothetical protein
MEMPGRTFTSGKAYRFTINGQEKTPEIAKNATAAEFWQYDSKIARRWNLDPITTPFFSPYVCFALNPIFYSDPNGDIFKIGDGKQTRTDVTNMVQTKNRNYLKVDENSGVVSLDFGSKSPGEIQKILNNDGGLNLINDLISAKGTIYYGAESYTTIINSGGDKRAYTKLTGVNINAGDNSRSPVLNLSKFGFSSIDKLDETPAFYDGVVIIDPTATFTEFDTSSNIISLDRSNLVFHELAENYERTENLIDYKDKKANKYSGAHTRAINRENNTNFHLRSTNPGMPQSQTSALLTQGDKNIIYSKNKLNVIKANIQNGTAFENEMIDYINYYKNCKRPINE